MATTKIQICPPPPPPPSPQITTNSTAPAGTVTQVTATSNSQAASQLQGFGSQPWQGWFSQVYNQIKTQFVVTTGVADGAAVNANTALADAATALAQANTAIAGLGAKLNKSAADVLTGAVSVTTSGGFVAGTLTWDGSGNRTGGYGVAMTSRGLVGYNSGGSATFAVDSSGNASFAGSLGAASGTFAGTLSAVNGTFTGTLVSVNGTFTGSLVAASGTFTGTVSAGAFNGGTVTGALIQTSASGQRLAIDTAGLKFYDSGGSIIGTLDSGGVFYSKPAGSITAAILGQTASNIAPGVSGQSSGTAPGVLASNSSTGAGLEAQSSGNAIVITSGANGIVQNGGGSNFLRNVFPITDNTWSLGLSGSLRWTAVYAMSSTITTSDGRTKNRMQPLEAELALVEALPPISYYQNVSHYKEVPYTVVDDFGEEKLLSRFEPVAGKRKHFGFDANAVRAALTAIGIDDAALWCLADPNDPDSVQSLRYEEFVPLLWGVTRQLQSRVKELEAAVAATKGGV